MSRAPALALLAAVAVGACGVAARAATAVPLEDAAVARGKVVFAEVCHACHGLRYLGEAALMPESAALAAFGKIPPDLSLMALARGRGRQGADYIAALLTGYTGAAGKNRVFPGIAMPAPFPADDPGLKKKADDVAAYLLHAADPHDAERRRLGPRVLAYLGLLTALLFLVYRRTWGALGRPRERPPRGPASS